MTGQEIAKQTEGCAKKEKDGLFHAYICPAGYPTIGWGHLVNSLGVAPLTQEQCDATFDSDWTVRERAAISLSPILGLPENKQRLEAIADFIFNLGSGRYQGSTLRKMVNRQDWDGAKRELSKWVFGAGKKLPGLIIRRNLEAQLL